MIKQGWMGSAHTVKLHAEINLIILVFVTWRDVLQGWLVSYCS